jgi:hypothetical protein
MSQDLQNLETDLAKLQKTMDLLSAANNPNNAGHIEVLKKTIQTKESEILNKKKELGLLPNDEPEIAFSPATPPVQQVIEKPIEKPVEPQVSSPQKMPEVTAKKIEEKPPVTSNETSPQPQAKPEVVEEFVLVEITKVKHDEIVAKYKKDYEDILEADQLEKMINNALVANSSSASDLNIQRVASGTKIKIVFISDTPKEQEAKKEETKDTKTENKANLGQQGQVATQKKDPLKFSKLLASSAPKSVEYNGQMISSKTILEEDVPMLAANGGTEMKYKSANADKARLTGDRAYNPTPTPQTEISREKQQKGGATV